MSFEDMIFAEMNGHTVEADDRYIRGYNQALEDIFNLAKQNAYDDGVDYSIGLHKLDELIAGLNK